MTLRARKPWAGAYHYVTFDAGTADFYNARIHTPEQPDIREEGAAAG